jgi:hypothetical protein
MTEEQTLLFQWFHIHIAVTCPKYGAIFMGEDAGLSKLIKADGGTKNVDWRAEKQNG